MTTTGAAEVIATRLVDLIGDHGSYALLLGLYLVVAVGLVPVIWSF